MKASFVQRIGAVIAAAATPCVVIAVAVLLFLNPIWVAFDQDRSGVDRLTGYTTAQVRDVTGSILSDLVFGPPRFEATLPGATAPVLDASERGHMADVRTVLMDLGAVALIAAILLLLVGFAARGRRWFWRAVAVGARILIGGVIVVGLGFAIFFDQAFELFHEIFFAPGTYMFDPTTEKLVQLFPDQFWSETSVAMAGSILVLGIFVAVVATRLGREPDSGAMFLEVAAVPWPPAAADAAPAPDAPAPPVPDAALPAAPDAPPAPPVAADAAPAPDAPAPPVPDAPTQAQPWPPAPPAPDAPPQAPTAGAAQ